MLVVYFSVSALLLLSGLLFPSPSELVNSVPVMLSVLLLIPIFLWYKKYSRDAELASKVDGRDRRGIVFWILALFALAMVIRVPSVLWFEVPYEKTPLVYLLILTMVLIEKIDVSAFGLRTRGIGKALLFGLAFFAFFSFLPGFIFGLLAYVSLNRLIIQSYDFGSFLLVLPFMICVGISEEGLFRGYMQSHLEGLYSRRGANLLQAVLFGLWHIVWYVSNPDFLYMFEYFVTTLVFGLFFGYFYSKARNIVPLIVAHGLHNSFFRGFEMNQAVLDVFGSLPVVSQVLMWLVPYIISGVATFVFVRYLVGEL